MRAIGAELVPESPLESIERVHPVVGAVRTVGLHHPMPQVSLPVGRRSGLPLADPVGAVEEALVVHPREAIGELEPLAGIAVPEVTVHRALRTATIIVRCSEIRRRVRGPPSRRPLQGLPGRRRQPVVNAPAKPRRLERLIRGQAGHHRAHDRPGELRGLLVADVGRDSELARELQGEPPRDGGVGNDDAFGREWVARLRAHEARELDREHFQPVRMVKPHLRHLTTGRLEYNAALSWSRWSRSRA